MFYGNAEDFKTYLIERGRDVSDTWTDEKIEAALLVASEWLDSQFEDLWIGYKLDYKQERSWPRQMAMVVTYPYYTFDTDELPEQVVQATYEAAQRHLTNPGCLQVDYQPSPYSSVSIYNAVTVEYSTTVASGGDTQLQIPVIQNLMSSLIDPHKNGDGNSLYGRAVRG